MLGFPPSYHFYPQMILLNWLKSVSPVSLLSETRPQGLSKETSQVVEGNVSPTLLLLGKADWESWGEPAAWKRCAFTSSSTWQPYANSHFRWDSSHQGLRRQGGPVGALVPVCCPRHSSYVLSAYFWESSGKALFLELRYLSFHFCHLWVICARIRLLLLWDSDTLSTKWEYYLIQLLWPLKQ